MRKDQLKVRGYLLHLTHYDPRWCARKSREKAIDLELAAEIIDELAAEEFNLLVIDIADGVRYKSHPELVRPYTLPMSSLRKLVRRAQKLGIEIVPKLNFSQGEINRHNHWMRPASGKRIFDGQYYWARAFDFVDQAIAACKPERHFHVGMDEDHDRSYTQYVEAIKTLRDGLAQRGLKTIIWNDSAINYPTGQIFVEKALAAERAAPRDVVHVLWNYRYVPEEAARRIRKAGLELWGAPGCADADQARGLRDAVFKAGGTGLLMTSWLWCRPANRRELLGSIRRMGPLYRGA